MWTQKAKERWPEALVGEKLKERSTAIVGCPQRISETGGKRKRERERKKKEAQGQGQGGGG